MSVQLLRIYLDDLGFGERDYAIGHDADDRFCLVRDGDKWVVYFSERGSRWDDVSFDSEKVACMFMLGLFTQRYVERWPRHGSGRTR
ncbi:hypothetical protein [Rhodococcus daqingensis]|uniref:Immunity protein 53 n=1 Tax=Rhodococcus daqingensis TaxID=2479363 RepID=A0ABW2S1T6_9NOCA